MSPAARPLTVAAAQAESVPGDVAANVATAVSLVTAAADQGARVVVLPELFLTGYDEAVWTHEAGLSLDPSTGSGPRAVVAAVARSPPPAPWWSSSVPPYDGPSTRRPCRCWWSARAASVRRRTTSSTSPGRSGTSSRPATTAPRIVVDGWDLALGVCYDGCFPEHAMSATAGGASAYLVPAAYYVGAEHRRDVYYAARALDNGIYVVLAGLTGTCGAGEFSGGSAVYDPEGRPVQRLGTGAGVAVADLDLDLVRQTQQNHPMARDRLDDLGPRQRVELG